MKPSIHMPRSRFDLSHGYKTMFDEGQAIPFYVQEIYPGDSFNCECTSVIRTSVPFLRPIMDNLFFETAFFFVPNRLTYSRFKEVLGENVNSAWAPPSLPSVPQVAIGEIGLSNNLADYLGLPVGIMGDESITVSQLPFRGIGLIYNEWFRNENISDPVYVNTGDNPVVEGVEQVPELNNDPWAPDNIFGNPFNVNKYKDYFTACLPEPQKGDAIDIPLNKTSANVITGDTIDNTILKGVENLKWAYPVDGNVYVPDTVRALGISTSGNTVSLSGTYSSLQGLTPANLHADLNGINFGNVNDLRYAFALQRMLEKDARGGTRYREYLYNHFGVLSPDQRMQVPEFLCHRSTPLNISQVAQTGATSGTNYQAQVSGLSLTSAFTGYKKGFTEHGFVIGFCWVRKKHTYQQGLDKFWMRKSKYDYYDPSFAFIGEQPVYNYEIFGNSVLSNGVFGYNEAYADLRFKFSKITSDLKSNVGSFGYWHLGDVFANTPVLNDSFIKEDNDALNNALAAGSSTIPNFIVDTYFKQSAVRVLPTRGIPGLIDHM